VINQNLPDTPEELFFVLNAQFGVVYRNDYSGALYKVIYKKIGKTYTISRFEDSLWVVILSSKFGCIESVWKVLLQLTTSP
jgi:hypothetical protein